MLKRQRTLPSQGSTPLSVSQDALSEDVIDIRDLKRRRVAPPSLDGQTRGWGTSNSNATGAEGEDEEEYIDSDEQDGNNEAQSAQLLLQNAEYAAVNSVLKEMHILHKHRQLFSPLAQPQSPAHSNPVLEPSAHKNWTTTSLPPETRTSSEESVLVFEHYEDTNRSLASAFLSRRQQDFS